MTVAPLSVKYSLHLQLRDLAHLAASQCNLRITMTLSLFKMLSHFLALQKPAQKGGKLKIVCSLLYSDACNDKIWGKQASHSKSCSRAYVSANPDISTPRIYTENSISCQCKLKELTFKDSEDAPKGLSVCPRLPVFCNIRFHMISCVMYSQCLLPLVEM